MALETGKQCYVKFVVKLTLSTISDSKFIPWLKDLLNDAPPMGGLMIEIESSQFMRNPNQYKALIEGVGNFFNIKFVLSGIYQIDTYYRVRDLQKFDFIKLNVKDLIFGFPRDPLNGLISTVKSDGGKIVAINVADAEMLNLATTFDIDYVHGYLVGRPFTDVITDEEGDLHCII
jgi:EAL domain-containing protein (putative c-di-GMP-specific phosphodiesterase class I)